MYRNGTTQYDPVAGTAINKNIHAFLAILIAWQINFIKIRRSNLNLIGDQHSKKFARKHISWPLNRALWGTRTKLEMILFSGV